MVCCQGCDMSIEEELRFKIIMAWMYFSLCSFFSNLLVNVCLQKWTSLRNYVQTSLETRQHCLLAK